MLAAPLLSVLVFCCGCSYSHLVPPEELCQKWYKLNDPSTVLEFSLGGHLFFNDGAKEHQSTFAINTIGKNIAIDTVKLGLPIRIEHNNKETKKQTFTYELISASELYLVKGAEDADRHRDEELIEQIAGRYVLTSKPTKTRRGSNTIVLDKAPASADTKVLQTSASVSTRLTDFRTKAKETATQLTQLTSERDGLVKKLRDAGVTSVAELKTKPAAVKLLAEDLAQLLQHIKKIDKRLADYGDVIAQLESAQRRFKWSEDYQLTAMSKADITDIEKILAGVDQKLDKLPTAEQLVHDIDSDTVLEEALGAKQPE